MDITNKRLFIENDTEFYQKFYYSLNIKPINFEIDDDRFLLFYLIVNELKEHNERNLIKHIKNELTTGKDINTLFISIVLEGYSPCLTIFKNEIKHIKNTDLTNWFFE